METRAFCCDNVKLPLQHTRSGKHNNEHAISNEYSERLRRLQVPMAGSPVAMASTMGRPQPSPRVGSTKQSMVLYTLGKSRCGKRAHANTHGCQRRTLDLQKQPMVDDALGGYGLHTWHAVAGMCPNRNLGIEYVDRHYDSPTTERTHATIERLSQAMNTECTHRFDPVDNAHARQHPGNVVWWQYRGQCL